VAEALRQPLHEMRLFPGTDLDRVTSFHREGPVRRDGIILNRTGKCRRAR
jgi:hypothetical protein